MDAASHIPSPSGTTRLFAHIGHPIAQVRAPALMNRLFAETGVDAVMVPVDVAPAHLDAVVGGLQRIHNLGGILVTVPHKVAVTAFAERHSVTVGLAGSANALRREPDGRWFAENYDGLGFVAGLQAQGHDPHGMTVALTGAGGAGVAIAAALVQAGVAHLVIADAAPALAEALAARLNGHRAGVARAAPVAVSCDTDLAINATPRGMRPDDALPFAVEPLPHHALVADIVMKPACTRLLRAALDRGLRTHEGIHMLNPQIGMYRAFFLEHAR